ncbi:hypothetical protein AJ79_05375 [Helicocarpus griseus UAMH5409]|uniref:Uncharacterized protein n=1 Tax=Helicocarpus griseus UAMH5409 TaxID=1447875 RepID=A0A2B7XPG6_9EURO|nr:hypothetical protein AJ79_05375 [Helicocarpus griseus UAMH5409]
MADHRQISTGRGGAGNMQTPAQAPPTPTPADLSTPTIKSDIYTTGRGGSGNMVVNEDPAMARLAQDVEPSPAAAEGASEGKRVFLGRGGAANVYDPEAAAGEHESAERDVEKGGEGEGHGHGHGQHQNPLLKTLSKTLSRAGEGDGAAEGAAGGKK